MIRIAQKLTIHFAGYAVTVLLFVALLSIYASYSKKYDKELEWIKHTQQIYEAIDRLEIEVKQGEIMFRELLLNEKKPTQEFVGSQDAAYKLLAAVENLARDNEHQKVNGASVRLSLKTRFDLTNELINLSSSQGYIAASRVIQDNCTNEIKAKCTADTQKQLNLDLLTLKAEETRLLAERNLLADNTKHKIDTLFYAVWIITFLTISIGFIVVIKVICWQKDVIYYFRDAYRNEKQEKQEGIAKRKEVREAVTSFLKENGEL